MLGRVSSRQEIRMPIAEMIGKGLALRLAVAGVFGIDQSRLDHRGLCLKIAGYLFRCLLVWAPSKLSTPTIRVRVGEVLRGILCLRFLTKRCHFIDLQFAGFLSCGSSRS